MEITKFLGDVNNISALSTKPNSIDGLTGPQLQAKWDKAGNDIKNYINNTLTTEIEDKTEILEDQLNTKIELAENYITITGNGDVTYNVNQWEFKKIELNTIEATNGTKLTLSENGIKIGAGINNIRLSGLFGSWSCTSGSFEIHIRKNNNLMKAIYYSKITQNGAESIALPALIIPVQENDIIKLGINCGTAGNYQILTRSSVTYLTAQVIN